MSLEKRSFLAVALAILLLAGCSGSREGPLYADPSGWSIVSDRSGEWWVEGYATMRRQGGQMYSMVETSGQLKIFEVLYEDDPQRPGESFWAFGVQVPDGMELRWGWDAKIHITAICKGETVRYTSQYLLFTNRGSMYGRPVPGDQVWSTSDVPVVVTPGRFFGPFKPENGNVIVTGKFDFGDCSPERIVRCDVSGVEPE